MKDLSDKVAVLHLRVLALEQENSALNKAVQDLSTCISQIAYSVSDLCSEAVKAQEQDQLIDNFLKLNDDDDGYLN